MGSLNHSRISAVIVFVCTLVVGCLQGQQSPAGKTNAVTADEYAVYAAAMTKATGSVSFVVMETTWIHGKPEDLDRTLSFIDGQIGPLSAELRKDFKSKNQQLHPLAQRFPTDILVTLLSESERSVIFSGSLYQTGENQGGRDVGWKAFYAKYPSASGITSVSRVGFNQQRDIALVYVSNVLDFEVGSGWYLILTKKDGQWKVVRQTRAWIS
jgi:hypothetical protein